VQLVPWRKVEAWKCLRCGKCCTKLDVMVTPDEERRLEKYGDVFERGRVLVYLRKVKGRCIFLENGNCAIYPERPMACVKYPFYFKSKGDAESRFDVHPVRELFWVIIPRLL